MLASENKKKKNKTEKGNLGHILIRENSKRNLRFWVCGGWFSRNLSAPVAYFSFEEQDKAFICVSVFILVLFCFFFIIWDASFLRESISTYKCETNFKQKRKTFPFSSSAAKVRVNKFLADFFCVEFALHGAKMGPKWG